MAVSLLRGARLAGHVVWTCLLFAAAPAGVLAQAAPKSEKHWMPTRRFYVPFRDVDPRIVEVRLYVSTSAEPTYRHVGAARPSDQRIYFEAPNDGWYYFATQTRDRENQFYPADLRDLTPQQKVCVDTHPPVITLRADRPQDGSPAAIAWEIRDDNFDDLRADYRSTAGGGRSEWYPLLLPRTATGRLDWTPVVSGPIEVRMQAIDKAKNEAAPQSVTVTPAPVQAGVTPAYSPAANDVKHVKSKSFQLNYELDKETVGPSSVAGVDIWKMRQGDRGWRKCGETGSASGPVTVQVEESGRWGFRLIPRSGVGLAEPDPRPGDPPDVWVEVDDKSPSVRFTNVVVGQGTDSGNLTVYWSASDPYLRARPISLFFAENAAGPWTPLAADLPNTGSHALRTDQKLPFKFYLKVTAIDEAGNTGEACWREVVKVDLKVPRIKSIGVRAGEASSQQSQAAPPRPRVTVPTGGGAWQP